MAEVGEADWSLVLTITLRTRKRSTVIIANLADRSTNKFQGGRDVTPRLILFAQFALEFQANLVVTVPRRHVMGTRPPQRFAVYFAISLWILPIEFCADENGKAIHRDCYMKHLAYEKPQTEGRSSASGGQLKWPFALANYPSPSKERP